MPELAPVTTRERERPRPAEGFEAAPTGLPAVTGPRADLLALQRAAGNRAVSRLLRDGGGQPIDAATRAFMESRFGHDFGGVRVHIGLEAAATAAALHARAFTVGRDVVFAPGAYQPAMPAGRRLLAHELGHVLQQRGATVSGEALGRRGSAPEQEADAAAKAVVDGPTGAARISLRSAAGVPAVQRFEAPEHALMGDATQGALSRVTGLLSKAELALRQGQSAWQELVLARELWERNGGPPEPLRLLERATNESDEARYAAALGLLEQATPLVVRWLQQHPEAGGGPTTTIAGREHPEAAGLLGADAAQPLTLRRSGLQVTYGEVIALGDFYRTPEAMHSAPREELITPEGKGVLDLVRAEIAGRRDRDFNRAYQEATEWREVKRYDRLGRMVGFAGGDLNKESYGTLAQSNPEHFAGMNRSEWERHHRAALTQAEAARGECERSARTERTNQAYTTNAFADHFLTDAFAAGHMLHKAEYMKAAGKFWLDNREELMDAFTIALLEDHWWAVVGMVARRIPIPLLSPLIAFGVTAIAPGFVRGKIKGTIRDIEKKHPEVIANAAVKVAHDHFNANGVAVQNQKGDRWVTFGDDHLRRSATTWQLASLAVLRSRADVTETLRGTPPADPLDAWSYTPVVPERFDQTALETVRELLRRRRHNPLADLFIKNLPTIEHQQEFEEREEEREQEAGKKRRRFESYLRHIRATGRIEDRSDSDDIARDIVATADVYRTLSLRDKALLILEMLEGFTGDDDERAILAILREVQQAGQLPDLLRLVPSARLRSDLHGEEFRELQRMMPGRDVSETVTETISNAPPPHGAWNNRFTWESRFHLTIDPRTRSVIVSVRLHSPATAAQKAQWTAAIEGKWSNRFGLVVAGRGARTPEQRYRILIQLQWVDADSADYTVTANLPGATSGGRVGLGGTTGMTGWGVGETVDVTHEFGHMLGNPEEYFTTNGRDYTRGGARTGFRDPGGGVMNNPSEDPFARHYELIRRHVAAALGVPEGRCTVR